MNKISVILADRKIISPLKYTTFYNVVVILLIVNSSRCSLEKLSYLFSMIVDQNPNKKVGAISSPWKINSNIKPILIKGDLMGLWTLDKKTGLHIKATKKGSLVVERVISRAQFKNLRLEVDSLNKSVTQAVFNRQKLVWS
jgi:hypothetical protein